MADGLLAGISGFLTGAAEGVDKKIARAESNMRYDKEQLRAAEVAALEERVANAQLEAMARAEREAAEKEAFLRDAKIPKKIFDPETGDWREELVTGFRAQEIDRLNDELGSRHFLDTQRRASEDDEREVQQYLKLIELSKDPVTNEINWETVRTLSEIVNPSEPGEEPPPTQEELLAGITHPNIGMSSPIGAVPSLEEVQAELLRLNEKNLRGGLKDSERRKLVELETLVQEYYSTLPPARPEVSVRESLLTREVPISGGRFR